MKEPITDWKHWVGYSIISTFIQLIFLIYANMKQYSITPFEFIVLGAVITWVIALIDWFDHKVHLQ